MAGCHLHHTFAYFDRSTGGWSGRQRLWPTSVKSRLYDLARMRGEWLVLGGLFLWSCTEPGRPAETGCTYAADCAVGESCIGGKCLPIMKQTTGCSNDSDCAAPNPYCDVIFETCRECTSNAHCPTEWTCDRGACVDQRAECTYDGMCRPPETVCADQSCVPGCNAAGSPIVCRR